MQTINMISIDCCRYIGQNLYHFTSSTDIEESLFDKLFQSNF